MEDKFILMKSTDLKDWRLKVWEENGKKCPVLGKEIPFENTTADHIHKLKSEQFSEQKGTLRGAIDFRCNVIEGKVTNAFKRVFSADASKHPITLPELLRNLADYIEKGAYTDSEGKYYVHPNEVPKTPKIKKSKYNTLKKEYKKSGKKAKFPEYPESGKSATLLKLFKEFNIDPF